MPRFVALLALLLLAGSAAAEPGAPKSTDRWYELFREGQKVAHFNVVWAPSTWEGKPTVHDTTIQVRRSVRNMMGHRDVFESVATTHLERSADGTLWWHRTHVREANRTIEEELTWNGAGYDHVSRLGDEVERKTIPLDAPVMTDAESFLGGKIEAGEMEVGAEFTLRGINVRAERVHETQLTVEAKEDLDVDGRAVPCYRVREHDPSSGTDTMLWIDEEGVLARYQSDSGIIIQRVKREQAERRPVRQAEFSITTPATPVLERIMDADRILVDLHLQGDANRAEPDFPDSPWSRVLDVQGSDAAGWLYKLELERYDDRTAVGSLPVDAERFAEDLESTVLMKTDHPRIQEVAREIVGSEKNLRNAAYRLVRWVFGTLQKSSPEVAEASALQILEECRGDCSEHCLLFVTLCRAAGIPARRCSGYVNIGSQWGAHAWAEIWVGEWIGADPTTGELGTGARYLFFGYSDDPDSHPGVVSARASGRMRFVTTRVEEGDAGHDLTDEDSWFVADPARGRYVHVLSGFELQNVPEGWHVLPGRSSLSLRGPDVRVDIDANADQGYSLADFVRGGPTATFAGAPAASHVGRGRAQFLLHNRRRRVVVLVSSSDLDRWLPRVERMLAPTFLPKPRAVEPPAGAGIYRADGAALADRLRAGWKGDLPFFDDEALRAQVVARLEPPVELVLFDDGSFVREVASKDGGWAVTAGTWAGDGADLTFTCDPVDGGSDGASAELEGRLRGDTVELGAEGAKRDLHRTQ